ncbi:hypothetical protein [Amycolatopsis jejuensis]|uniref:hypothetical protein n=1 Tax=Amycolatopsis jejuensis TaxID=330084 RepID=UPI000524B6BE|nr:hypothetical protein [Amycolatopsis jejuensis]
MNELEEALRTATAEVERVLAAVQEGAAMPDAPARATSRLLSLACRAYAVAANGRRAGEFAQELEMSTSEACVAATALLRSQELSPFEFGIWFVASESRGQVANLPGGGTPQDPFCT